MKQETTVIFDLDGTLINTDLLIRKTFEYVFALYKPGYTLSEEELLSFLGPTLTASFSRYFSEDLVEELIHCYREYNHAHHIDYVTIYDNVLETLKTLKEEGYPLAVVTTKYSVAAYIGLDMFDMRDMFDIVLGMDQVERVKPDPDGINKVLEMTKTKKAFMIGDNESDILAGQNAGIQTIGVSWTPKGRDYIEACHPDYIIDDMSEVLDIVKGER